MRCVTSRFRNLALGAALALGFGCAAVAQTPTASLSLPEARNLAAYALQNDQPALALQVGAGLLQADPRDPFAHYVIAAANAQLNRPTDGRRAAARAYRFAEPGPDRYRAAQLAARLAYAEDRPTLAQLWLRRTAIHTPSEADEKLLARDYQTLRRQNPWSFSLRTDLRPSSNVNNGADSSRNVIDGVPDQGFISPTSQALSGLIGSVDLSTGYRLRANTTSATYLTGRLYVQRVSLSDASRARAPTATNSNFGATYGEVSLRHAFAAGPPDGGGSAQVSLTLGDSWYGDRRTFRFARGSGERNWRLNDSTYLQLNASLEDRFDARSASNDARIIGLGAALRHRFAGGGNGSLTLDLRDAKAKFQNGTYRSASLRGSYAFARPVGPAKVSAGLTLGYSDYPSIFAGVNRLNTAIFAPRDDKSIYGDVTFFFEDFDYAGFAPTLRLRAGRKKSNISLYSTREFSLSLGIQSKF